MVRTVVVQLWTGACVVARLGPDNPAPSLAELDAVATAWTAANDGVRPRVRVLEQASGVRGRLGSAGPAGTVPR